MEKTTLGFALTGSFCTFKKAIDEMKILADAGYDVLPIMSENAYSTNTRFGKAADFVSEIEKISGKSVIHTIPTAEPIGPRKMCDVMLVAPCTGNTLSKISLGITDTPVTMAVKSQLRIGAPVLLAVSTNDALGACAQNIGRLMNTKNIFFVPMSPDDPEKKPNSLVAHFEIIPACVKKVLSGNSPIPL